MKNYLFCDDESGEEFYVQEETLIMAKEIANRYFESPRYICIHSDFEAEMNGLDTY